MAIEVTNEKKYVQVSARGHVPFSPKDVENTLKQVGQEHTLEFVLRDIEAGIPYQGANFRIKLKDAE